MPNQQQQYAAGLGKYTSPDYASPSDNRPSPVGQVAGSALGTFAEGMQAAMLKDPTLADRLKAKFGFGAESAYSAVPAQGATVNTTTLNGINSASV